MIQENKQPQLSDYVGMRFKDFRSFADELGETFVVVVFEGDKEMLIKLSGEEEEYSYKDKYIDLYYILRMFAIVAPIALSTVDFLDLARPCIMLILSSVNIGILLPYRDWETDRKSTRLNSSHSAKPRMPSSA